MKLLVKILMIISILFLVGCMSVEERDANYVMNLRYVPMLQKYEPNLVLQIDENKMPNELRIKLEQYILKDANMNIDLKDVHLLVLRQWGKL